MKAMTWGDTNGYFIFSGEISSVECITSKVIQCLLGFVCYQMVPMLAWRGGFCRELSCPAQPSKALPHPGSGSPRRFLRSSGAMMVFGLTALCFAELGWEQPVTCRAEPLVLHTVCTQPGLKPGTQQILQKRLLEKNLGMWCFPRIARGEFLLLMERCITSYLGERQALGVGAYKLLVLDVSQCSRSTLHVKFNRERPAHHLGSLFLWRSSRPVAAMSFRSSGTGVMCECGSGPSQQGWFRLSKVKSLVNDLKCIYGLCVVCCWFFFLLSAFKGAPTI